MPLDEINALINLEDYRRFWKKSLKYNGKVACKGVEPANITGHVVIDADDMHTILATGGDSVPTPVPYMLLGGMYRETVKEMFVSGPKNAARLHIEKMYGRTMASMTEAGVVI